MLNKLNPYKLNRLTVRFTNEELILLDRVVQKFQDMNRSIFVRMAVKKFAELVLFSGKIEVSMIENGK